MTDKEYPNPPEPNLCGGYYCSEEHGHIDCHNHICHCVAFSEEHETGVGACYREMTQEKPELQRNGRGLIGGVLITATSLFEQRLYFQHPCGCWSRSKDGSTNSLEA